MKKIRCPLCFYEDGWTEILPENQIEKHMLIVHERDLPLKVHLNNFEQLGLLDVIEDDTDGHDKDTQTE